jgi:hypothetical protein
MAEKKLLKSESESAPGSIDGLGLDVLKIILLFLPRADTRKALMQQWKLSQVNQVFRLGVLSVFSSYSLPLLLESLLKEKLRCFFLFSLLPWLKKYPMKQCLEKSTVQKIHGIKDWQHLKELQKKAPNFYKRLTHLTLWKEFNQSLVKGVLPNSLTHLTFDVWR